MRKGYLEVMEDFLGLALVIVGAALAVMLSMQYLHAQNFKAPGGGSVTGPDSVGPGTDGGGTPGFSSREAEEVAKAMEYASQNTVVKQTCGCKSKSANKCPEYANWIVQYSKQYGIPDPLLIVSLMMQESSCSNIGCNRWGYGGLMQISCKTAGWENPETNIKGGINELKGKYDTYKKGRFFEGCSKRHIFYTEWDAALRGYNGWECEESLPEQDYFVDEVMERYQKLKAAV